MSSAVVSLGVFARNRRRRNQDPAGNRWFAAFRSSADLLRRLSFLAPATNLVVLVVVRMASHIGEAGMSRHVPGSPRQQAEHIVRQEAARFADVGWTVLPAVRTVLPLIKFFRTDILQQLSPKWLQKRKGGYKGRSGIERFLFGSVSNRVMYHARCSVWVVRG